MPHVSRPLEEVVHSASCSSYTGSGLEPISRLGRRHATTIFTGLTNRSEKSGLGDQPISQERGRIELPAMGQGQLHRLSRTRRCSVGRPLECGLCGGHIARSVRFGTGHGFLSHDRLEVALRHLGTHFYEARTRDKVGTAHMRAFATPGTTRDVIPSWLVTEASTFSKAEYQRNERVETEIRMRGKGEGKGKGKEESNRKRSATSPLIPSTESDALGEQFLKDLFKDKSPRLFPLTLPPQPSKPSSSGSRSRQRFTSKMQLWKATVFRINVLNQLYSSKPQYRTLGLDISISLYPKPKRILCVPS